MKNIYFFFAAFLFFSACRGNLWAEKKPFKVTATTSLVSAIVSRVGGELVEVTALLPPAMCPGHYDAKVSDAKALSRSDLFLKQGFEKWDSVVLQSSGRKDLKSLAIAVEGNLMVPEKHVQASEAVLGILSSADPEHQEEYQENFLAYKKEIDEEISRLPYFQDVCVIADCMQAPFLERLGMSVAASFGPEETLASSDIKDILEKGRSSKAVLVIANLQTLGRAGEAIASEMKIPCITLSNFPLDGSYILTLKDNIAKIREALK